MGYFKRSISSICFLGMFIISLEIKTKACTNQSGISDFKNYRFWYKKFFSIVPCRFFTLLLFPFVSQGTPQSERLQYEYSPSSIDIEQIRSISTEPRCRDPIEFNKCMFLIKRRNLQKKKTV